MSKRYRNKTCVYCGVEPSVEGDHVFAREFFPEDQRHNLPKAPTCKACNGIKSSLEHYLVSVLPFGSNHVTAQRVLAEKGARRLAKNQRLKRALGRSITPVWTEHESGLIVRTITLGIDTGKVTTYFGAVARGLLWWHWEQTLDADHANVAFAVTETGTQYFLEKFWPKGAANVVSECYAGGALEYLGRRSEENPKMSVWLIRLYGGIGMRGEGQDAGASADSFISMTARERVFTNAQRRVQFAI